MNQLARTQRRARWLPDLLLACVLAAIGTWVGITYYLAFTSNGHSPVFYQDEFGPAVLEACGRGYLNPRSGSIPALSRFLTLQSQTFDCSELPQRMNSFPPNSYQANFRYWLSTVALYWKFRGVSWTNLGPLFGIIHGATVAWGFLALRVVLTPLVSATLASALAISPAQLSILPYMRDSTKAPFFMAVSAVVLLIWRIERPGLRAVLSFGLAFGGIVGIGLGFRPDVVAWFPTLLVALFCTHHSDLKRRVMVTAVGGAAALVMFVTLGWPILSGYAGGSNFGHVAILGYTKSFDTSLGVGGVPYSVGTLYNDSYVNAAVTSYAKRRFGHSRELAMQTREYERYASSYFWEIVKTLPADAAIRFVSAIDHVLNLPFTATGFESNATIQTLPFLRGAVEARTRLLGPLEGWGVYLMLTVILFAATRSPIFAAGLLLTVLFLGGLPAVQFDLRHYAYLELLGLIALGLVAEQTVAVVRGLTQRRRQPLAERPSIRSRAVRAAVFASVIAVVPLICISVLRGQQQRRLEEMIDIYDRTATDLPYSTRPARLGSMLVVPALAGSAPREPNTEPTLAGDYLIATVRDVCDTVSVTMRIKYAAQTPAFDFSRNLSVSLWPGRASGVTRLFVPIYQHAQDSGIRKAFRFEGFEVPEAEVACLADFKRVEPGAANPLWFELELLPGWRERSLYQKMIRQAPPDDANGIYLAPPHLVVHRSAIERLPPAAGVFTSNSRVAKIDRSGIVVDGRAESPFTYLVTSRQAFMTAGSQVISVGDLQVGGFTLGLLGEDGWKQQVNVTTPGPFIAAVEVPTDGTYTAVVANVNETDRPTRFHVTKLGWTGGHQPHADALR